MTQKINQAEFDVIRTATRYGSAPLNPIVSEISSLDVGQGLIIKNEEWTRKGSISSHAAYQAKKLDRKFITRKLADRSGVAVLRRG